MFFADQLAVAVVAVTRYVESYELAQQLQQAMQSRAAVEQAKGILMAARSCTSQQAFEILVGASQNRNRKLQAIAMEIVGHYDGDRRDTTPG